jgi:hypothetical protein
LWTNADPPLAVAGGEVLATRVPLTAGPGTGAGQSRAVVARSPQSRRALMDLIADEAVRAQVAAINLRTTSVLLLIGVAAVDRVEQVSLHELVAKFEDKTYVELRIAASGATQTTATVVAVDRLPVVPSSARLLDPIVPWLAHAHTR